MKGTLFKIASILSMLATVWSIERHHTNNIEIEALDFNKIFSYQSINSILLASNASSAPREALEWLEKKQETMQDQSPVVVCDNDISRTGGKRKAFLLNEGYQDSSIITLYNSLEMSCYMIFSRQDDLVSSSALSDTTTSALFSYKWKIRANTIDHIFELETAPLINTIIFQNKDELHSASSKIKPSYDKKVLQFINEEILNEFMFFRQDLEKSDSSAGLLSNKNDISSICKASYSYIKFSHEGFMTGKDLMMMTMDTRDMKEYILKTYESSSLSASDIFNDCVLSIVMSTSLLPEVISIEVVPPAELMNDQSQYLVQVKNYTEKHYPWYDVGLTGKGEVVAVSDTGLDVDNCYFWDSENDMEYGENDVRISISTLCHFF